MKRYVVEAGDKVVIELGQNMDVIEMSKEGKEKEIRIIRKAVEGSEKYANPPIPEGYKHVSGTWDTGFVIERQTDGSQLVWIPVGSLYTKENFEEILQKRFGITNYQMIDDEGKEAGFYFHLKEWERRMESLKKYGGFYFSAYEIVEKEGKTASVFSSEEPILVAIERAEELARNFERAELSGLPFIPEYAWVFEWLIKSEELTFMEVTFDSTGWGDYSTAWKVKYSLPEKFNISSFYSYMNVGKSSENKCKKGIHDLAGKRMEFVIDLNNGEPMALGGESINYGFSMPATTKKYLDAFYKMNAFRVVLYLK